MTSFTTRCYLSNSNLSTVPLARPLGSKRPSMQSLASKSAWDVSMSQKNSQNANFVRPDCPPVESDDSFKVERKVPDLDQVAARSFEKSKYPGTAKFRSALEQVSWMTNSKLWDEHAAPDNKGLLGFLGL